MWFDMSGCRTCSKSTYINTWHSTYFLPEPWVVFRVSVSPNWPLIDAGEVYRALNTLVGPISSLQWRMASSLAKMYARIGPLWEGIQQYNNSIIFCFVRLFHFKHWRPSNPDSIQWKVAVATTDTLLWGQKMWLPKPFAIQRGHVELLWAA